MSENHTPDPDPGAEPWTQADAEAWNAEIDPSDAAIAWNFGTHELTPGEYDRFAEANSRDLDRAYAAREADEVYARWAHANPEATAQHEAAWDAAELGGGPWPTAPWLASEPGTEGAPEPETGPGPEAGP